MPPRERATVPLQHVYALARSRSEQMVAVQLGRCGPPGVRALATWLYYPSLPSTFSISSPVFSLRLGMNHYRHAYPNIHGQRLYNERLAAAVACDPPRVG